MPASSLALVILAGLIHAVWNIVAKRALPGSDVAEAAYAVAQVNHLAAQSRLQPGQVLLVPR